MYWGKGNEQRANSNEQRGMNSKQQAIKEQATSNKQNVEPHFKTNKELFCCNSAAAL